VPKAKELRPFVERLITIAKRGLAAGEANGRLLTARRLVLQDIQDRAVVGKLFDEVAPRFESRPGGYTRLLRIGFRRGDGADVAQVELVGSEYDPNAETEKTESTGAKPKKSVGQRLRATADRLRGKKDDGEKAPKAAKPSRGAARKVTTPRKAGGS
jgi:large subunit ribosomal protein L17